jgi:hypothetical protein
MTGARTPLTVDLSDQRVAITAGANGIGKVMADRGGWANLNSPISGFLA